MQSYPIAISPISINGAIKTRRFIILLITVNRVEAAKTFIQQVRMFCHVAGVGGKFVTESQKSDTTV
ncbi:hypothetical protein M5J15_15475 [Serratia symbiotica]|uniref:hypothetical protein n=1 Tax=Serratia symbiotica TaxID=138074 RepID=UPI0020910E3F|nr:hypothetical protein [Serratia symbiotica]USS95659.1 hypothetical protein M5J15_15475 [Serratia symbiotica]